MPLPPGPRVAGIDPGAHWIAIEVAEGPPLRHVAAITIEIGRLVLRPTPKVLKNGAILTHRRDITDADVEEALGKVVEFLELHGVSHAVVEKATNFHGGDDDAPNVMRARAALLLRSQWVGGELAGALLAAHRWDESGTLVRSVARVESVSSREWRANARKMAGQKDEEPDAGVTPFPSKTKTPEGRTSSPGEHREDPPTSELPRGAAHPSPTISGLTLGRASRPIQPTPATAPPQPPAWASAVRSLLPALPPGEHILDAAGCALWAVRPPAAPDHAPRARRPPKAKRAPAPRPPRSAPPPCTCGPGGTPLPPGSRARHVLPCPRLSPKRREQLERQAAAAAAYVPMTR